MIPYLHSSAICVLLTSVLGHALAQDGVKDSARTELQEITIQGELIRRSQQKSTTSTSVFQGVELDYGTDAELYDIIERTPNASSSFGDKGFVIRGIDQRGQGGGGGLLINVSVDGVSLPSNQSTFFGPYSSWDLESVEVLRGPQSTQTGRNALAGAISVRSADPIHQYESKFRLEAGQRDTQRASAAINIPVIQDKIAVRLAADKFETDGWVENPTIGTDAYDARKIELGRAKILFTPNSKLRTVLGFSQTANFGGEDLIERDEFPRRRINRSDLPAKEGSVHDITSLENTYTLNNQWSIGFDINAYRHRYQRTEDGDFSPTPGNAIVRTESDESTSGELRLSYAGQQVEAVLGYFTTRVNGRSDSQAFVPLSIVNPALAGVPGTINAEFDNEILVENQALFGELDYRFAPKWTFTAGLRQDYEKQANLDTSNTGLFLDPNPQPGQVPQNSNLPLPPALSALIPLLPAPSRDQTNNEFNALLPKLGISREIGDHSNLAFTIQQAYRAGGVTRNIFTGQLSEFDPEYLTNYEISFRNTALNGLLKTRINAYYADWKDQQVVVFGPSGNPNDTRTVNAGKSKIYGLEMDSQYQVRRNLKTYVGVGLARTEFVEFNDNGRDLTGNQFAAAPRVTANSGVLWNIHDSWFVSLDGNYTASSFSDAQNNPAFVNDARTLWNFKMGYDNGIWGINLIGRNIFDKDYIASSVNGSDLIRTGEPAALGVQFTYNHF